VVVVGVVVIGKTKRAAERIINGCLTISEFKVKHNLK
jgi:hypothetical protein